MHVLNRAIAAIIAVVLGVAGASSAFAETGVATTTSTNVSDSLYAYAASEGARDLIERVDDALNALNYTIYEMSGDDWNDEDGEYVVDCSGYINHMLEDAVPEAYDEVRSARNVTRPSSSDFYYYFRSIALGGTLGRWRRPAAVKDLRPGDLVVTRYLTVQSTGSTGHTMIVVNVPVKDTSRGDNIYRVRVSDAARSGHTRDNRTDGSGVGAGEILIKTSSSGQPIQYSWSLTGSFKSDAYLALGRPRY